MSTSEHPALNTDYDSPPALTLVLPEGLGKDEVLAGLAQAIGQARARLARRALRYHQYVVEHAARGDQLHQAGCRGQVIASSEAVAYIDESIVAAFDLWNQYDAQLAAQATAATGAHAEAAVAAVAASACKEPLASPAGRAESPADAVRVPGPPPAGEGDVRVYIEAAGEAALRGALRAVAAQLDGLRQVVRASQALGESAKAAAHDQHAAALQAASAGHADTDETTADAVEAYATSVAFDSSAFHIGFCVNAVATAVAGGLGLTGRSPGAGRCS